MNDVLKLGSLVSGVVDRVAPDAVIVYVNAKGYSKGTIYTEHLADHHGKSFCVLVKSFSLSLPSCDIPSLFLLLCRACSFDEVIPKAWI